MTFKNEYIPPIEQETSEFLKRARSILNTGHSQHDKWTVDHVREMVMTHVGSGKELEDASHDLWGFVDRRGYYVCSTDRLSRSEVSPEVVAITYKLQGFWQGERYATPDAETIGFIREALEEYKDWGLISDYKRCQLTLIDAATGKEI